MDSLGGGPAMMTYQRYDVALQPAWLRTPLDVELTDEDCTALYAMDNAENITRLLSLGHRAAAAQLEPVHFPYTFDI